MLLVSLSTAQEEALEKVKVLKLANQVFSSKWAKLKASLAQAKCELVQRTAE